MDYDQFNMSVRKFLKKVGITSQRQIEEAVRRGLETNTLEDSEILEVKATISIEELNLTFVVDGQIALN